LITLHCLFVSFTLFVFHLCVHYPPSERVTQRVISIYDASTAYICVVLVLPIARRAYKRHSHVVLRLAIVHIFCVCSSSTVICPSYTNSSTPQPQGMRACFVLGGRLKTKVALQAAMRDHNSSGTSHISRLTSPCLPHI